MIVHGLGRGGLGMLVAAWSIDKPPRFGWDSVDSPYSFFRMRCNHGHALLFSVFHAMRYGIRMTYGFWRHLLPSD